MNFVDVKFVCDNMKFYPNITKLNIGCIFIYK